MKIIGFDMIGARFQGSPDGRDRGLGLVRLPHLMSQGAADLCLIPGSQRLRSAIYRNTRAGNNVHDQALRKREMAAMNS